VTLFIHLLTVDFDGRL